MFISEIKLDDKAKKVLSVIEKKIGFIPIHFELLANLNLKKFKLFMQELSYIQNLKDINKDFFVFIRLYVAFKENFEYCKVFNKKLLLSLNYTNEQINSVINDISNIPLDNKHKSLAIASIKAIYEYKNFTNEDINNLKNLNWSDEYIYAAIDHTAMLFKNARILRAYLK